nr:cystathionine gamma-synthase 1 chloroplastic [Tanacetum cinerariifolium]
NASGGILGPFDCFLTIRGIETLPLRIERTSKSALEVAKFLETRPEVARVYYPGLESHPNHEVAKKQQSGGFGGIIALALTEDTNHDPQVDSGPHPPSFGRGRWTGAPERGPRRCRRPHRRPSTGARRAGHCQGRACGDERRRIGSSLKNVAWTLRVHATAE